MNVNNICIDCELKKQMAAITKESLMEDIQKRGIEVSEEKFNSRLDLCSECFNLQGGIMCDLTGAYCIYLAAKQNGSCPRNKW